MARTLEEISAYQKEWRAQNKERVKENSKKFYEKNKEKLLLNRKIWYKNNFEKTKETRKKYLAKPEVAERIRVNRNEWHAAWRTENPERYKERNKSYAVTRREKRNSDKDSFIEYAFASLKRGAYKRNISWNLEFDQFKSIAESVEYCALSNRPVFFEIGNRDRISVDRIDNTRGYDFDNIQFVSAEVNMIRNSLSMQDFLKMCFDIAETHGYKKKKKK
jgi:hypothetical protein